MIWSCPNCGGERRVSNPDARVRCACGWDSVRQEVRKSWVTKHNFPDGKQSIDLDGWEFTRQPTSRRCVMQVVVGEQYEYEHRVSRAYTERYAARVGADYVVVRDNMFPAWQMANKWLAGVVAAQYDKLLFVDTDVMIADEAPDLFSMTRKGQSGFFDELPSVYNNGEPDWFNSVVGDVCRSQKIEIPAAIPKALNGGIMLIDNQHAGLYVPPRKPVKPHHLLDQLWLQITLDAVCADYIWFSGDLYSSFIDGDFWETWNKRPFVHFNGCQKPCHRRDLMRFWIAKDYRRIEPPNGYWQPKRFERCSF